MGFGIETFCPLHRPGTKSRLNGKTDNGRIAQQTYNNGRIRVIIFNRLKTFLQVSLVNR